MKYMDTNFALFHIPNEITILLFFLRIVVCIVLKVLTILCFKERLSLKPASAP